MGSYEQLLVKLALIVGPLVLAVLVGIIAVIGRAEKMRGVPSGKRMPAKMLRALGALVVAGAAAAGLLYGMHIIGAELSEGASILLGVMILVPGMVLLLWVFGRTPTI